MGLAVIAALFVRKVGRDRKALHFIFVAAVAIGLLMGPLANLFVQVFPRYAMYDGTTNTNVFSNVYGGRIRLLYAVMLVACLLGYNAMTGKDVASNRTDEVLFVLFPLCLFASVLGLAYGTSFLINRLLWFYMVAYISFIPAVIGQYHSGMNLLLKMGFGGAIAIWIFMQFLENQDAILPYVLGISLLR